MANKQSPVENLVEHHICQILRASKIFIHANKVTNTTDFSLTSAFRCLRTFRIKLEISLSVNILIISLFLSF